MQQYPNIKLTVVTNIFGSFGNAPPLAPEQESDTLANYFLGFHRLKGTHIVYKTDYIKLPGYDRRIVGGMGMIPLSQSHQRIVLAKTR